MRNGFFFSKRYVHYAVELSPKRLIAIICTFLFGFCAQNTFSTFLIHWNRGCWWWWCQKYIYLQIILNTKKEMRRSKTSFHTKQSKCHNSFIEMSFYLLNKSIFMHLDLLLTIFFHVIHIYLFHFYGMKFDLIERKKETGIWLCDRWCPVFIPCTNTCFYSFSDDFLVFMSNKTVAGNEICRRPVLIVTTFWYAIGFEHRNDGHIVYVYSCSAFGIHFTEIDLI